MYILKKLASSLLTILIISFVVFFIFQIIPGDPVLSQIGIEEMQNNERLAERIRQEFELDIPVAQRYVRWIGRALTGNLGQSFQFRRSVTELISSRLVPTFSLAFLSMAVVVAVAIPLGIYLSGHEKQKRGAFLSTLSQIFLALPGFWVAIMLLWLFAFKLHITGTRMIIDWNDPLRTMQSLALPVTAMSLGSIASVMRYVRTSISDQKHGEYVKAACAKGLTDGQVMRKHILKNSLIPVITILGLVFISLLTGSIIIENVFTIQGIGTLLIDAINQNDYPLVQGIVLYYSVIVVAIGLILDFAYMLIDPRIKGGGNRKNA